MSRAFLGSTEVWRRDPVDTVVTSGTGTITAPSYAALMDVGVIGGGASGSTGDNGVSTARGTGAPAAVWMTATVAVKPGDVYTYTVGTGGAAKNGVRANGESGTASTVTGPAGTLTSPGSTGPSANTSNNNPSSSGAAASSIAGLTLPGSSGAGEGGTGGAPGAGGGGGPNIPWLNNGSSYWSGAGGRGEIRYRFRSY